VTKTVAKMKKLILITLFILLGTQSFANTAEILMKVDEMNTHIELVPNYSYFSLG